ncbi:MAG: carboxypeptidase-like regulatory domain-containing protein, partial [Gemmatimonadaceae bacterium]
RRTRTDAAGEFRFEAVTPGRFVIHVRRLGFALDSAVVDVPLAAAVIIELREAAQPLDTVSVTGRDELLARGKLAGFYERKKFGIGRFLEEKDIEKYLTRRLADIIVARIPGTRAVRSPRAGMAAYISTFRMAPRALVGAASSGSAPPGGAMSRRTPQPTQCYPDVYLDGVAVYSSGMEMEQDVGDVRFDVNSIDPAHVSAIEFYGGPAQMPAQFNRTGSACGALLIWTK